jgi:hypothetical protein
VRGLRWRGDVEDAARLVAKECVCAVVQLVIALHLRRARAIDSASLQTSEIRSAGQSFQCLVHENMGGHTLHIHKVHDTKCSSAAR